MKIRHATVDDTGPVVGMAHKFHEVSGYSFIPFDIDTQIENYNISCAQELCYVAEHEKKLIGFILGIACPSPINRNIKMGCELAWWVEPEHRNGLAGVLLLKRYEQGLQENGLICSTMMCLESLDPDKISNLYERMGYEKAERTFLRRF